MNSFLQLEEDAFKVEFSQPGKIGNFCFFFSFLVLQSQSADWNFLSARICTQTWSHISELETSNSIL